LPLNRLFPRHGFDGFLQSLGEKSGIVADKVGRPSVAPGIHFRMSLVGYFERLSKRSLKSSTGGQARVTITRE
jgi:hypothetical protein